MIEFVRPWLLWLLPLPLAAWYWLTPLRQSGVLVVPNRVRQLFDALRSPVDWQSVLTQLRLVAGVIGWLCLVGAAASPVTNEAPQKPASGRDLILALDLSASMLEKDVSLQGRQLARIDAVKAIAGAFVRGREGDRIGLIVFADDPYLIAPLTFDVAAVESFLDEVGVGLPGRRTAIGDAISLSVQQLVRQPASSRVIILLSDGDSNAGAWGSAQASALAQRNDIRIHTIGFGAQPEPKTALDPEPELAQIASATGGRYFAADSTQALRAVYDQLDAIEPTVSEADTRPVQRLWTHELLMLVVVMWLLGCFADWQLRRL